MSTQNTPTATFILHELDESLSAQLCKAAADSGLAFYPSSSTSECLALAKRLHADGIFCSSEPGECRKLLTRMKGKGLHMPVVVVSRIPEVTEWLGAIEAGATDYCAAPFEQHDISWLLQSMLPAAQHVHVS
jgi:DNA-binding NtrC family response regulator